MDFELELHPTMALPLVSCRKDHTKGAERVTSGAAYGQFRLPHVGTS